MRVALRKNTRTAPAVRAQIAASDETTSMLTRRLALPDRPFISGRSSRVCKTTLTRLIAFKHSSLPMETALVPRLRQFPTTASRRLTICYPGVHLQRGLALGPRQMPAAARRGKSQWSQADRARTALQNVEEL